MSYCKINIGGKERGLKFNQMAIMIYARKVDNEDQLATAGYALIYAGLKANAYTKGEECDFTFEQVCDWVDELDNESLQLVTDTFKETQRYKKGSAYIEEEKKNNPAKKKSVMKSTKVKV
jgi:hypothetical protein